MYLTDINIFAWGFAIGGLIIYVWQNWATVQSDVTAVKAAV
jgi:hypothetical protein